MLISRFMLIVGAIVLGFSNFGCLQSHSGLENALSADENKGQALAEGPVRAEGKGSWWLNEAIVAELELSDDQVQIINQLMIDNSGDAQQKRQRERQLSLKYLRALAQEPYDPALVDRLSERLTDVMFNDQRRRIENARTLRDIMTQEQWSRLWEVAPRALQIGRFVAVRGPKIAVVDNEGSPTPAN